MKKVAILGSTGSIGTQTLEIISSFSELYKVSALSAHSNMDLLSTQIQNFHPSYVSVHTEEQREMLHSKFPDLELGIGEEGLCTAASLKEVSVVVVGIVGFSALRPTLSAIQSHKRIAQANKETLVTAGHLIHTALKESQCELIPVDSEHSAIFQLMEGRKKQEISSLVLTASGGPFFRQPQLDLNTVTPEVAVKHPNWKMGAKISVDSATLMNKGLEVIEAHMLFDIPTIEVWIHPQSIVHGALWLKDNSCLTQLNLPSMKLSLGYALAYPERLDQVIPKLSLSQMQNLEFYEVDEKRFPCFALAKQALHSGPSHLIALNAANEIAVQAFLDKRIRFTAIPILIQKTLEKTQSQNPLSLEEVFAADESARALTLKSLDSMNLRDGFKTPLIH